MNSLIILKVPYCAKFMSQMFSNNNVRLQPVNERFTIICRNPSDCSNAHKPKAINMLFSGDPDRFFF